MLTVVIIMTCGMVSGYLLRHRTRLISTAEKLTMWSIYLLLLLLGVAIGVNNQIISNLHTLGLKALIITAGGMIGSVLLALPVYNIFFRRADTSVNNDDNNKASGVTLTSLKGSLIILAFFATGVVLGILGAVPERIAKADYSTYALYLLMFLVGVGIGADSRALGALRRFSLRIFLVPLTTIVGTLVGAAVAFPILSGQSLTEVLAVGSGFGYYSLSSIIITELRSAELGVVALLSNVMREITTLLLAPMLAKYMGKLAPIVAGGATSMDTTLPIITASSGKEYAIVSLFHGIVLTILVPFLVTFLLSV